MVGGVHVESIEVSARTVSSAVQEALGKLGKKESEVDVTVLSRGRPPNLLVFGAELAQVRVEVKTEKPVSPSDSGPQNEAARTVIDDPVLDADPGNLQPAEFARTVLTKLLNEMGLSLDIQLRSSDPVILNVVGPGVGDLIGRRGTTLRALQFVLNLMVNKQLERRVRLVVDADGYRQRREHLLQGMAERLAQRVSVTGQQMALEPMPPNERRIVHMALADNPDITTESEGTGDDRRVVVKGA